MTEARIPDVAEWAPLPAPPGRRFEPIQERELDEALRSLARRLPGVGAGARLTAEFAGPNGIADLVVLTHVGDALADRISLGRPTIASEADAAVAAAVAIRRTTRAPSIAREIGMSEGQVERRLRTLSSAGFIAPVGTGYRRDPRLTPIGRLLAMEAKVDDWRRGMRQALRYGEWADASAVVLLKRPREILAVREAARQLRLGLAIGDRWVVRPVLHRAQPGPRLYASELLVETALRQSPSADA